MLFPIKNFCFLSLLVIAVAIVCCCEAAPRVVRDEYGNQLDFPDGDGTNVMMPTNRSKGFIQSIIDMIKRLFGWEDKMIVREDGSVEWVDNGSGGFLSRMGKRVLQMINYLLSLVGLTEAENALGIDMGSMASRIFNELEKEAPNSNKRE